MVQNRLIDNNQKEDYVYAMMTFVEKILGIGSILLISLFIDKLLPTILFLIAFLELRKRTGGYHANTFLLCYVETIGMYIIILYINSNLFTEKSTLYIGVMLASIIIFCIGTVNHPCMHLSKEEILETKKTARVVLFMELIVMFFMDLFEVEIVIISYMASAIMICAISLVLSKGLQQEVQEI